MPDVSTYEDVPLPATQVWDVIGDFANIRKWAVIIKDETVTQESGRTLRTLTMPDGNVVKEVLVVSSQFSYTYAMADDANSKDYRSTVAVVPLDESSCRIELIVHVGLSEAETEEEVEARYARFVRGNLKAMKKALGLV